ncbi:hypothetical protein FB566_4642 [Stackebrandtia endophytica]|uniref:Excreted virulence factor EspC (Type VII ESX diderm) n=1 Tax=Stackebrandtia endophytica TaxID=1496996 RepID=A0A543B2J1_9ACTN|nr:hypothetical protein [Stackebrandtia endophytica]TQL79041.1 hypothetical protein FB566_4642 [Stackebrandtia endophytica]
MEIDLDEIRKTGNEYFPAVADEFERIGTKIGDLSLAAGLKGQIADGTEQVDLQDALNGFHSVIAKALTTSADYLEDCGECLVQIADEYDSTDQHTAEEIYRPSAGFEDQAYNKPDSAQ